jgi:uncharacterized membrane protein YkoI
MIHATLNDRKLLVRHLLLIILLLPLALSPMSANAFDLEQSLRDAVAGRGDQIRQVDQIPEDYRIAQTGGMSLSEATAKVRRDTGGQIVSAQTKVSNGRETHHIKVLTKDGKVKTVKIAGRSGRGG